MSQTSRSSYARPQRLADPHDAAPCHALRLMLRTQPRSGRFSFGGSVKMRPTLTSTELGRAALRAASSIHLLERGHMARPHLDTARGAALRAAAGALLEGVEVSTPIVFPWPLRAGRPRSGPCSFGGSIKMRPNQWGTKSKAGLPHIPISGTLRRT